MLTPPGASSPTAPQRTEYGYDDDSRLVGVRYPEGTVALYQLDSVGNRVGERKAPSSAVSALTAAAFLLVPSAALSNDVLASFNRVDSLQSVVDSRAPAKNASFLWDEAGNLVRQTSASRDRRFDWDIKQTLTRVSDDGLESGRYDYGSDGLRTKRLTSLESVEYVLDGDEVLLETDGASPGHPAKRRYTFGAAPLAVTDINGSTRTTRALHVDALGSPGTETTLSASIAVNRQYDAWGAYRNGTAPTEVDAKLGFTGHQYDVETGLTYARARYYDAEYGRFLSRDSVEGSLNDAPSLHRYAYVRANPLRYRDPTGHCIFQSCAELLADLMKEDRNGPDAPIPVQSAIEPQPANGLQFRAKQAWDAQGRREKDAKIRRTTMNESSLPETMAYTTGEHTGINSLVRATTRQSETGRGLSIRETAENYVEGAQKLTETTVDVATFVEGAGMLRSGATKAATKAAVREEAGAVVAKGETQIFESLEGAAAEVCPCFEAGTLVQTQSGPRPIEDIRVGELVLSRSDTTGEVEFRPVLQLFITPEKEVFELRLADEFGVETTLSVTPNHPFWVRDIGWVGAASLASGIEVSSVSGGWLRVTGATWHQRKTTVFNFEVDGFHTYFVGSAGAWVHNTCSPGCGVRYADEDLQAAVDLIHEAEFGSKGGGVPMSVTQAENTRVVVTQAGRLPGPRAREAAKKIFGENVEIVGGTSSTNALGVRGGDAEARAIKALGPDAPGARQATTHYACEFCEARQAEAGVVNVTGTAREHGTIMRKK